MIECAGNVLCSKITATDGLSFGSNIELADTASERFDSQRQPVRPKRESTANEQRHVIYGNLYVEGNVVVTDVSKSFVQENLAVSNAIIEVGGSDHRGGDTWIVFHQYNEPNVMAGYVYGGATIEEFAIGRTNNGPSATNMNIYRNTR